MPMSIECPSCGTKLKFPDSALGRKVKCPKCATLMDVGAVTPGPAPPVAADNQEEVISPPDASRTRDRRKSRKPAEQKKSKTGLIIGLLVGLGLVLLCCCPGAGIGIYYLVPSGGSTNATRSGYDRLKTGMSSAAVQGILGKGRAATASDVKDAFEAAVGPPDQTRNAFETGVTKGTVLCWKNGSVTILVLFKGPPSSGGKATYFLFTERTGKNTTSAMNGTL